MGPQKNSSTIYVSNFNYKTKKKIKNFLNL